MRLSLFACTAALALAACASSKSAETATPAAQAIATVENTGTPGQAAATRTTQLSAKVTAVDAATRSMTIQGPDGSTETVKVPPEVKRFAEIAVGDNINVVLEQGLLLEFQPAGSETVEPQAVVAGATAGMHETPGAAIAGGVMATVTVTKIDSKTRVVSLQGPKGKVYQVKAGPKVQLDRLKVGDRLLATYVESVAIQLEKAGTKM
jgi:hypothetical protein